MTLNKPRSSFQERDSHSGQPYNVRPLTGLIIGYRHAPLSSGAKAAWLDSHLWKILEAATGLCIPRTTTDAVWNCLLPVPVEGKESISFQGWVVSPPVRLGGFGFRSHQDTAKFAFIGALEQAIPAFQGERGVCPQLAHQMGGDDCFGEGAGGSRSGVSILMSYGVNPHYVKLPIFSEFMESSAKFMKNSGLTKWTQNLR